MPKKMWNPRDGSGTLSGLVIHRIKFPQGICPDGSELLTRIMSDHLGDSGEVLRNIQCKK